ncbi:hypothetical protein [Butyrivibrio sp. NC2002]|uniref:hypothetical protein n=1 Tax=Butyrivibrio sp. NC2002 TaxID=1410610 RepID=UPI000569A412|nr:hypothetical protein [Butyrivibrio sp. NC2002]
MPKLPININFKKPDPKKIAETILYCILGAVLGMVAVILIFAANPQLTGMVSDVIKKSNEAEAVQREVMANAQPSKTEDIQEEATDEAQNPENEEETDAASNEPKGSEAAVEEKTVEETVNAAEPN